jgi:RinA family phage transcriptional activator
LERHNDAFPRQKRRAWFRTVEQELYTFERCKAEIARRLAEIDEIAGLQGSSWPKLAKDVDYRDGKARSIQAIMPAAASGGVSDPTPERAEAVRRYKEQILGSLQFRVMVAHVEAIESVLTRLERSDNPNDRLKLELIREKYFRRQLTDAGICTKLQISERSFYRWRRQVIVAIADQLGYIV